MRTQYQYIKCLLVAMTFPLVGCIGAGEEGGKVVPLAMSNFDVNMYPMHKLVCDPWDSTPPAMGRGLKAQVYYLDSTQPHYNYVQDYIDHGHLSDRTLFFTTINVPTRNFATGFPSATGEMIKKDDGSNLLEWFAVRFNTVLKLRPDQEEGEYEFSAISDDGMIIRYRDAQGVWQELVNNDYVHAPTLGCSAVTLNMTRDTEIMLQIDYFQGPQYAIAAVPLWRKVTNSAQTNNDPECGRGGGGANSYWFLRDQGSAPTAKYTQLLSRGWAPIQAENYFVPVEAQFNPCVVGVAPRITNFTVTDILDGFVEVEWDTDIMATSQVRYVDLADGTEALTMSDNVLRKHHRIVLRGLAKGHTYVVQGVSISETYGKSLSLPETVTAN